MSDNPVSLRTKPARRGLVQCVIGGWLRGRYRLVMHGPGYEWVSADVPSWSKARSFRQYYRKLGYL